MANGTENGEGSAALAEAHRKLLSDTSIQFELPVHKPPTPPAWIASLADFFDGLAPYMTWLFSGMAAAAAAVVLFVIWRETQGMTWRWPWRRAPGSVAPALDGDWRPDAQAARVLLSEAEALAARGDYGGAVHLLLKRSVDDIGDRLPDFLKPSLTARDIAGASPLPERARLAFRVIAAEVEQAVWAREPVGAEGWRRAREAYRRFAFPETWA